MTRNELIKELLHGRILLAGNYRGSQAEMAGYVDRKTGTPMQYVRAIHLLELECGGRLDRAIIYQRLPEIIETPEEAVFPYTRGRVYAFFLESVQWERGQVTGRMGKHSPEWIEDAEDEAGVGPVDAPQGAATGTALP